MPHMPHWLAIVVTAGLTLTLCWLVRDLVGGPAQVILYLTIAFVVAMVVAAALPTRRR